jgi:hypothetical protein
MMAHILVGLVFESTKYGKSNSDINQKGIFAFGKEESKINGHHIGSRNDNSPDNIEFVSTNVHKLIHKHPNNLKSELEFIQDFSKIAQDEEPTKPSVLFPSELIYSPKNLKFTGRALKELNTLCLNAQKELLVREVVNILSFTFGVGFFIEPKYFSLNNGSDIYICKKTSDSISIKNSINPVELIDKHFIACYVNSKGYAECDLTDLDDLSN